MNEYEVSAHLFYINIIISQMCIAQVASSASRWASNTEDNIIIQYIYMTHWMLRNCIR